MTEEASSPADWMNVECSAIMDESIALLIKSSSWMVPSSSWNVEIPMWALVSIGISLDRDIKLPIEWVLMGREIKWLNFITIITYRGGREGEGMGDEREREREREGVVTNLPSWLFWLVYRDPLLDCWPLVSCPAFRAAAARSNRQ